MRILFLTIFILTIFISFSQKNISIASKIETKNNSTEDTFSLQQFNQDQNCGYDNQVASLGIGLIIVPSTFEIYNDSLLSDKIASVDTYEASQINLCSKFFKPDYGIMHFVCISKSEKAYKILVNFSDVKYLPNIKNYDFKTWDEYISQSFGIRRCTNDSGEIPQNYTLRIKPEDNADTLAIPKGHELFCPMEIKGDWIKVKYDCFYNAENNSHEGDPCYKYIDKCKNPLIGWLRWRRENHLIIDIFLMP